MLRILSGGVALCATLSIAVAAFDRPAPDTNIEVKAAPLDLAKVPELFLQEAVARPIDKEDIHEPIRAAVKKARESNSKSLDGFVTELRKSRADLRGLPFLMGDSCRLASERRAAFAVAGETAHMLLLFQNPGNRIGEDIPFEVGTRRLPVVNANDLLGNFQEAFVFLQEKDLPLLDAKVAAAPLALFSPAAALALSFRQGAMVKAASPEHATRHMAAGQIAALMQILMPEPAAARVSLAKYLAKMPHPEATRALAQLAVFSEEAEVHTAAAQALAARKAEDYTDILVNGLNYPWPVAAQNASAALVRLKRAESVPQLVGLLEQPEPGTPAVQEIDGKKVWQVRELVRINHHRNCLLCHSAAATPDLPANAIQAQIPSPHEPLPSSGGYNEFRPHPDMAVRIDVTYLRQDFSKRLPVANANPWPMLQRFDFLVRTRTLTEQEAQAQRPAQPAGKGQLSPYRQAVVTALRGLTGRDAEPTAAAWRKLLASMGEPGQQR